MTVYIWFGLYLFHFSNAFPLICIYREKLSVQTVMIQYPKNYLTKVIRPTAKIKTEFMKVVKTILIAKKKIVYGFDHPVFNLTPLRRVSRKFGDNFFSYITLTISQNSGKIGIIAFCEGWLMVCFWNVRLQFPPTSLRSIQLQFMENWDLSLTSLSLFFYFKKEIFLQY